MEPLNALSRATAEYERRLVAIAAEHWDQPSVCEEWSVRDIADHVVGGNRFAVGLLAGQSAADAIRHAHELGFEGDPASLYRASAEAQLDAFRSSDALARVMDHPVGRIDARQFLGFRLGDLVLHGWDLARSTGGDDSLDDELLPMVWDAYQPIADAAVNRGAFAPAHVAAFQTTRRWRCDCSI